MRSRLFAIEHPTLSPAAKLCDPCRNSARSLCGRRPAGSLGRQLVEMLMANERCSKYRGCSINARWAESGLPEETLPGQFAASFSVESSEAHDSVGQQFPE